MSSWSFAPKITRLTFSGTGSGNAKQVENGEPIRVWGFVITNTSASNATVTIEDGDGSNVLHSIVAANRTSFVFDTLFIADKGFRAYSSVASGIEVIVFHSHPGS